MEKPLRGAIACPECGCMFQGRYFSINGERGYHRRCPNGHTFKNPSKPRKVAPCPSCAALRAEVEQYKCAAEEDAQLLREARERIKVLENDLEWVIANRDRWSAKSIGEELLRRRAGEEG